MENLLSKLTLQYNKTVLDILRKMEENGRGVVYIVKGKKLVGKVCEHDIRKGLIAGLPLETFAEKIMKKKFLKVESRNRASALDLMQSHGIESVPIVEKDQKIVGIHFLHELIGYSLKSNTVIIMAGGKGTRLYPLTENCPKPMIKVAGRPILERIILNLVGYGFKTIYISINYLGKVIEDYFKDGKSFGCQIQYLKERKFLGTGGALSLLKDKTREPLIVMYGDLVTQINFEDLLRFHQEKKFIATIGATSYEVNIPFGVLKNKGPRLVALQEKPSENYFINAGIYILNSEVLKLIPKNQFFPLTMLFEKLLKDKKKVGFYPMQEDWIDVGEIHQLRKANGRI